MKQFVILLSMAACLAAQDYPPAQGPPPPPATDSPETLQIRLLVDGQVRDAVDKKLNAPWDGVSSDKSVNVQLASRSDVHAVVSATSFTTFQPSMTQTTYPDKPNSRYLAIPYMIELTVGQIYYHTALGWINYPWNRKIGLSLQVGIFCDHWETGVGQIVVHPKADPPYLDSDPDFSEEVVNALLGDWLIPLVDSKVRQGLSGISLAPTTTPFNCNYLDFIPGDPNDLRQGILSFEEKRPRIISARPSISVKLVEVTRLVAHDFSGSPVYYPTETNSLSFYANSTSAFKALPAMTEGQTVSLASMPTISLPGLGNGGSLVLIASLTQTLPGTEEDSNYLVFPITPAFGGGRQKIQIWKSFWYRPTYPPFSKPTKAVVEGYEITVDISVPNLVLHP